MLVTRQLINCLEPTYIQHDLESEISDGAVDEIYRFGQIMLTEVNQRVGQIDQKLYSVLGWSSASIAFLLLEKNASTAPVWIKVVLVVAVLFALAAILLCSLGIKSAVARVPSEVDWFCKSFYLDSSGMARHHVLAMFEFHQRVNLIAASKAEFLARAELAFIPCVGLVLFIVLFQKLFV